MAYTKLSWQNGSTTPLNARNLNHMDEGIFDVESRTTALETSVDALETNALTKTGADFSATAAAYNARGIYISSSAPSGTIPAGCIWAVYEA